MKITKLILDLINYSDKLSEEITKNKEFLESTKDKRILLSKGYLLNEDLKRVLSQLTILYKFSKLNNEDLNIEERDLKRLDYLLNNELVYYIPTKQGVIPKNPHLETILQNKINEQDTTSTGLDKTV